MRPVAPSVSPREHERVAALSCAQEALWFIDAMQSETAAYNVPLLLRWHDGLDRDALATALRVVASRHEVLRTTYETRDGEPVQVVHADADIAMEVIDLSGVAGAAEALERDALARAREPFDLADRPPVRCAVWLGAPEGPAMLLCLHHIAVDGWSVGILLEELAVAYVAARDATVPELSEPAGQYADYAAWDRAHASSPAADRRLAERAEQLRSFPARLALGRAASAPANAAEPAIGPRPGANHVFNVPAASWSASQELARRLRATPYVVLLAAFEVLIARWSREPRFVLGTVMANRPRAEWQRVAGFFANTVPLRCEVRADTSFEALCLQARAEAFVALDHQTTPFHRLVTAVARQRSDPGGSLAQVVLVLQNAPAARIDSHAPFSVVRYLPTGTSKFDVSLFLEDSPEGLTGTLEYDIGRYGPMFARQLADGFVTLLAAAVEDPGRAVGSLPLTARSQGELAPGLLAGERLDLVEYQLARLGAAERSAA